VYHVTGSVGSSEREVVVAEAPPTRVHSSFLRERAVPVLILVATTTALVLACALPLSNTDTYFHLRFGHEFLHGWSLREPGSVSTFATAHWVPTQWLPEIVMAKVEDWFGLAGVAWLSGLQMMALAATLYLVARRWGSRLVVSVLVTVALSASYLSLSMRPQVLSYLFLVVTLGAWLRTRDDGRLRWWLVPLTWLWAMVHGMWPLGIGIGLVALVGMALDHDLSRRDALRGAAIPLLSAVVAAFTPVGPELYLQLVRVQERARFFSEWRRPNPLSFSWIVLAVLLVAAVVLLLRTRPVRRLDVMLVAVCVLCSVWSWRTVPVSAFLLVPTIAALTGRRSPEAAGSTRSERALVLGGTALALTVLAVLVPSTSDRPPAQPSWVDPALRSLAPGTKVVDSWDWGGYLMWRYPQLDLLMHGYGDTYTVAELQRNSDIEAVAPGWQADLRRTGCTVALLRPSSKLAPALAQAGWTVVHRSAHIEELRAPSGWTSRG
jgi:hypothetical protein